MGEGQTLWCPGGMYCDCLTRKKGDGGFRKLLESKSGLIIYGHIKQDVNKDKKDVTRIERKVDSLPAYSDDVASPDETKAVQTDGNVIIVLQNTKDNDVNTLEDVLPEFDLSEVSCPRCRHLMIRAKALLKNVPVVEKNNIKCVCDICNLKRQARAPCLHCLNAIKKFKVSGFVDSRKEDVLKKQVLMDKQKRDLRAYSDVNIAKIVERRSEQMHLERSKSGLVLDNTFEFVTDKGLLQTKIDEKKVRVTIPDNLKSEAHKKVCSIPRDDVDSQMEIVRESLKPIMKPVPHQAISRDKKTPYRSGDEALSLKSETVLGLGTTGMMRRYHSEESITSFSGIKEEIFKKNFKYFFPRMIKQGKGMYKTSAELIRDTRERFQAEIEEKIRKHDELRRIKKEKELKKSIGREEIQRKIEWAKKKGINLSDIDITTGKILLKEKGADKDKRDKMRYKDDAMEKGKRDKMRYKDDAMEKDKRDMTKKDKRDMTEKDKRNKMRYKDDAMEKDKRDMTEKDKRDKRDKMRYKDDAMEKDKRDMAKKDKGGVKGKYQGDVSRKGKEHDSRKDKGDAGAKDKEVIIKKDKDMMGKERAQTPGKRKEKSGKEQIDTGKEKGERRAMEKGEKPYKGKEEKFTKEKREPIGKETQGKLLKGDKPGSEKRDAIKVERSAKVGIDKSKEYKDKGPLAITSGKEPIQKQQARVVADKIGDAAVVHKVGDLGAKTSGMPGKDGGTTDKVGGAPGKVDVTAGKSGGALDKTSGKADKAGGTMDEASGTADIVDKNFPQDHEMRQEDKEFGMQDDSGVPIEKRTKFQEGDDDTKMDRKGKIPGLDKSATKSASGKKGKLSSESSTALEKKEKEEKKKAEVNLLNKVLHKQEKEIAFSNKFKNNIEDKLHSNKQKAAKAAAELQGYISKEYLAVDIQEPPTKSMADKKTKGEKKPGEVGFKQIEINVSGDDLILKMVKMRGERAQAAKAKPIEPLPPVPRKQRAKPTVSSEESELELDVDNELGKSMLKEPEIVYGHEIIFVKDVPPEPEPKSVPVLFQSVYKGDVLDQKIVPTSEPENIKSDTGGSFRYALSNRKYINNGWTVLPTEKIVRKMNVFRMYPAQPEFDWFEHNKKRGTMQYSSGEKLAEIDNNGRGRWYYKNGRLALDYYNCEELNAHQRFVIYSSGEPDDRGRSRPITVLGMFDYNGNGVVFDHGGKIRLKYNQNEGVVLDRGVGPVSHWKWHSLNDPPELQQVMIDTQLDFKDPDIYFIDESVDEPRQDDETMLAIEFDNFLKARKKRSVKQEIVPHQINMKTMKINEQFTLKVLDQTRIYLLFREGGTTMKCNLGLKIDQNEIVDTGFCEIGEVSLSVQKLPAATGSIENLQKSLLNAQKLNRVQTARELRKIPHPPGTSADRLIAAASRPLRPPLQMEDPAQAKYRIPNANNLYYNTRLI